MAKALPPAGQNLRREVASPGWNTAVFNSTTVGFTPGGPAWRDVRYMYLLRTSSIVVRFSTIRNH
jgi:hypothetical protein